MSRRDGCWRGFAPLSPRHLRAAPTDASGLVGAGFSLRSFGLALVPQPPPLAGAGSASIDYTLPFKQSTIFFPCPVRTPHDGRARPEFFHGRPKPGPDRPVGDPVFKVGEDPVFYSRGQRGPPVDERQDRKSTRLNSSHIPLSRMPS